MAAAAKIFIERSHGDDHLDANGGITKAEICYLNVQNN